MSTEAPQERHLALVEERPDDDQTLVEGYLAGDSSAAGQLFDRYGRLVRSLAARSLDRKDVDDIAQESFLRFFEQLPRLKDRERVRSFLVGIALRVIRDHHRRSNTQKRGGDLIRVESEPDAHSGEALSPETASALRGFLQALDPETRSLLLLRVVEEMEIEEIGDALGVSHSTAKRRVARALRKARDIASHDPRLSRWLSSGS